MWPLRLFGEYNRCDTVLQAVAVADSCRSRHQPMKKPTTPANIRMAPQNDEIGSGKKNRNTPTRIIHPTLIPSNQSAQFTIVVT